jgi:alpha-1,2-glucosyltransferase
LATFVVKLYREDFWGRKLVYEDLVKCMDMTQPYILVILKFIVFVYMNNGIVVGDKTNHQATFHLSQIFYFMAFSSLFTASTFLFSYKKLKTLFTFICTNFQLLLILVLPVFCLIAKHFSFEHPFLLADNRHYTFYIWSKFIRKYEFARYLLTPMYVIAFYTLYRNLVLSGKTIGWLLAFSVCVLAALVPQELVEFRYFIIPYFIYRLNLGQLGWKQVIFEIVFNAGINFVTIYVFVSKTFKWVNEPEVQQRFMW